MKKQIFWTGLVSLGLWLTWFLIESAPRISLKGIDPIVYHILFVGVCLTLILLGLDHRE